MAANKNKKIEENLRSMVEAQLRREFEKEFDSKIAEASRKIEAEAKQAAADIIKKEQRERAFKTLRRT